MKHCAWEKRLFHLTPWQYLLMQNMIANDVPSVVRNRAVRKIDNRKQKKSRCIPLCKRIYGKNYFSPQKKASYAHCNNDNYVRREDWYIGKSGNQINAPNDRCI